MGKLDSLDEKLIQLLGQDAHRNSVSLGKQFGVSPTTIRRRVKKLIQSGIMHIIGVVEPAKLGFPLTAVIAFDVSHDKLESVTNMLASRPEIKWVSTATGRYDIIAVARFRSTDDLSQFMEREMAQVEGLRDSETFICLRVKKGRWVPFADF